MQFNYVISNNHKIPIFIEDKKVDTTFLFLHGINSSSDFIKKMLEYPHDYNTVAINFPGSRYFGDFNPEDNSLNLWIDAAKKTLEGIKTKNIVIVAHSMGGGAAVKIGKEPRIKRIIMLGTINPYMQKTSSYSMLQKILAPKDKLSSFLGKLITSFSSKMAKTKGLVETFTRKGSWYKLLEDNILNETFLENLDKDYLSLKDKMIFVAGEKDKIVGTKHFLEYADKLKVPAFVVGRTHSPIRVDPEKMALFFNSWERPKKRHFWQGFVKFKNQKFNFVPSKNSSNIVDEEELFDELEKQIKTEEY